MPLLDNDPLAVMMSILMKDFHNMLVLLHYTLFSIAQPDLKMSRFKDVRSWLTEKPRRKTNQVRNAIFIRPWSHPTFAGYWITNPKTQVGLLHNDLVVFVPHNVENDMDVVSIGEDTGQLPCSLELQQIDRGTWKFANSSCGQVTDLFQEALSVDISFQIIVNRLQNMEVETQKRTKGTFGSEGIRHGCCCNRVEQEERGRHKRKRGELYKKMDMTWGCLVG